MGQVTLFLCGDVMTGHGVDQVLPRPGDLGQREARARDARTLCSAGGAGQRPDPAAGRLFLALGR
jgi:poly-gamma-glutamate capsule biosynthesis protein CapA/YwtB (metallophosphatase superfamily)